jgi:hypothetical protein
MSDMFGFDPKVLSNDDLFNKQVDLTRKKVMAARLGRMDAINQLDIMIRAIETERQERMFVDRWKTLPSSPVVIETDPSLRQADNVAEETKSPKSNPAGRPIRRTIRTTTPVSPDEE